MTTTITNEIRDRKYVQSPQVVSSKLGEDIVVMNPETGKYLALNPVAAVIFETFAQPHTPAEVIERLMQQFNVDEHQCTAESIACIRDMLDRELLKEA